MKEESSDHNSHIEKLDKGTVRQVLSKALDMWARPTELNFTEVHPDDETADLQGIFL